MFYVYVLQSKLVRKTYVGYTNNLKRRIKEHNTGKSVFSKSYMPWILLYNESFVNLFEAIKREKYFKSSAGRRWMKKNLFSKLGGSF